MNVRTLAAAQIDVIDIADAYDIAAPNSGTRFFDAVDDLIARLSAHPRMYGRVIRAPRGREVRVGRVTGYPYLAHDEVTATEVIILSVTRAEGAQPVARAAAVTRRGRYFAFSRCSTGLNVCPVWHPVQKWYPPGRTPLTWSPANA